MCGVFATTRPDLWRKHVPEILARLRHRGPDASGVWESPDGRVLMAHTRLSIIGLDSAGAQPATSNNGRVTLVYNGEIYNYRDLGPGVGDAAPRSDTAVLAELLASSGATMASRLRGMFAFVSWDSLTGTLSAVRDPYGIKPLYLLRHSGGGVTLCSEIPPLLLLTEARQVDPIGLAHYLCFGHTGPSLTLFERISKVLPGTVTQWRARPEGALTERVSRIGSAPVDACNLSAALEDSVRSHLVADVEVGVFLSGGIDSTLLAAVASTIVPGLPTFTISFPGAPGIDESKLAEANARLLKTRHRTVCVRPVDMVAAAAKFTEIHGEPFGDAAALPLTVLAESAGQELKVVLTGEGADELIGGYGRYRISARLEHPVFTLTRHTSGPLAAWWGRRRGDAPWERAFEAAAWGGGHRSHAALLGSDLTTLREADTPFANDVEAMMRTDWLVERTHRTRDDREVARCFDRSRLPNTYLEKTDRATMASSLEARVPYLDPTMTRALVGRPVDTRKLDLRRELARRLPGVVLPNRKKGLAVSLSQLLDCGLDRHARYELGSSDSVLLAALGREGVRTLSARSARSHLTSFRVAMLGQWEATLSAAGLL